MNTCPSSWRARVPLQQPKCPHVRRRIQWLVTDPSARGSQPTIFYRIHGARTARRFAAREEQGKLQRTVHTSLRRAGAHDYPCMLIRVQVQAHRQPCLRCSFVFCT